MKEENFNPVSVVRGDSRDYVDVMLLPGLAIMQYTLHM